MSTIIKHSEGSSTYLFPLDHFGLVAAPLIDQLTKVSGDKRKRKTALNDLVKIAKISGQLPKEVKITMAGLYVDSAGQISLGFTTQQVEPKVDKTLLATAIIEKILDSHHNGSFRELYPIAYNALRSYKTDMIADVERFL